MSKKAGNEEIIRLEQQVIGELKTVYDPEIPVNIYDLGLVYEIRVDEKRKVLIMMTLTAPNCPVAESLPAEVKNKIKKIKGVTDSHVEIVFDPPWSKDMMSESAMLELGFL